MLGTSVLVSARLALVGTVVPVLLVYVTRVSSTGGVSTYLTGAASRCSLGVFGVYLKGNLSGSSVGVSIPRSTPSSLSVHVSGS